MSDNQDNWGQPIEANVVYVLRKNIDGSFYWFGFNSMAGWLEDWGEAHVFNGQDLLDGACSAWRTGPVDAVRLEDIERFV